MYTAEMIVLLVLTILSTVYANVYVDSKCPEVKSADNFNFAGYGSGIWYEVARYPHDAEKDANCGYGVYTLKGDYVTTENFLTRNNEQFTINGTIRRAEDAGNTGKLIVTITGGSKKVDSVLNVLDTDYDNYAIAYYCKFNEEKNSRQDFAWILSRSKILSSDIKVKVENFIRESKVLDYDKLIWPETSCC